MVKYLAVGTIFIPKIKCRKKIPQLVVIFSGGKIGTLTGISIQNLKFFGPLFQAPIPGKNENIFDRAGGKQRDAI